MRFWPVFFAAWMCFALGCGGAGTPPPVTIASSTYLYSLNPATHGISGFKVNNDGSLASTGAPPVSSGDSSGVVVGNVLYLVDYQAGAIGAYSFDAQTGALSAVAASPFAAMPSLGALAACPGRFLFAVGPGSVKAYTMASNGALTPATALQAVPELTPAFALADSTCKFLFVGNGGSHTISVLSLAADGTAAPVAGSPFAAGGIASSLALGGNDKFLYSADAGNNTLLGFFVNSTTGALTALPGSPYAAGAWPVSVAVNGSFVYVANSHSDNVSAYAMDATTGVLSPVAGSPFAAGGAPMFALASMRPVLYVANNASGTIGAYTIDTAGKLTPIAGSPFPAAAGANWLLMGSGPQ